MSTVNFHKGSQGTYLNAWSNSGENLSAFKYANSIYFAYDKGVLYLDGSAYGVTDPTQFDRSIVDVEYTPATKDNAASLTFKPASNSYESTVIYLPKVSSASQNLINVTSYDYGSSCDYEISMKYDASSGIGVGDDGLMLNVGLDYTDNKISLKDKNGNVIGAQIDATDFTKDKFLSSASYVTLVENEITGYSAGNYLKLDFSTVNRTDGGETITGTDTIYVDVTKLNKYVAGKGISISDTNTVSINLSSKAETQKYLNVEDGSLTLTGIEDGFLDASVHAKELVTTLGKTIDNYTINDISLGNQPLVLNSGDLKIDYNDYISASHNNDNYIYDPSDGSLYTGYVGQNDTMTMAFIKVQNKMNDLVENRVANEIKNNINKLVAAIGDSINASDVSYIPKSSSIYHYINNLSSISEEIENLDTNLYSELQSIKKTAGTYDDSTNLPGAVVSRVNQSNGQIDVIHQSLGSVEIGTSVGSDSSIGIKSSDTVSQAFEKTNNTILWHTID